MQGVKVLVFRKNGGRNLGRMLFCPHFEHQPCPKKKSGNTIPVLCAPLLAGA